MALLPGEEALSPLGGPEEAEARRQAPPCLTGQRFGPSLGLAFSRWFSITGDLVLRLSGVKPRNIKSGRSDPELPTPPTPSGL